MPVPKSVGGNGTVKDLIVTEAGPVTSVQPVRTRTRPHPRLVNRGASGLLHKASKTGGELVPQENGLPPKGYVQRANFRIHPTLLNLAVPIEDLVPDPLNARIHPEKNMESIRQSLLAYGQRKPIVVRAGTNVIVAGNGTCQAARELGWTEIAAVVQEMTDHEAAGYGLADNRSAEFAKWDFEVVALLDKMLQEVEDPMPGWSVDELKVLRAAEWIKPEVSGGEEAGEQMMALKLMPDQMETIGIALGLYRERVGDKKLSDTECIVGICNQWLLGPREFLPDEQGEVSADTEEVPTNKLGHDSDTGEPYARDEFGFPVRF